MNIIRYIVVVCALLLVAAPIASAKQSYLCPFPAGPNVGYPANQANLCPLPTSQSGILSRYLCDPSFSSPATLPKSSLPAGNGFPCGLPETNPCPVPSNSGEDSSGPILPTTTNDPVEPGPGPQQEFVEEPDTGGDISPGSVDTHIPDGSGSLYITDPISSSLGGGVSIVDDLREATGSLAIPVALPGFENPPTDPDGDGLFEDLNGNGRVDFGDINAFYANLEWIRANEPLSLFDMDGDGQIGASDIPAAYGQE